ncbi:hypothetical protein ACXPWS_00805 [Mycobacterium sp. BMJ-28]
MTAIAQGAKVRAVRLNELGGVTFRIEDFDGDHTAALLDVAARLRQSPDGHYAGTARR